MRVRQTLSPYSLFYSSNAYAYKSELKAYFSGEIANSRGVHFYAASVFVRSFKENTEISIRGYEGADLKCL